MMYYQMKTNNCLTKIKENKDLTKVNITLKNKKTFVTTKKANSERDTSVLIYNLN